MISFTCVVRQLLQFSVAHSASFVLLTQSKKYQEVNSILSGSDQFDDDMITGLTMNMIKASVSEHDLILY